MRILAFAASMREGSLNRKLIAVAADMARGAGADVDVAEFREFDMPLYDGDRERDEGLPPGARRLRDRVGAADALMIASPEYNYSIPGTLKNAIDWVSRARPMPWRAKSVLLLSASPSAVGGVRGLWQTRIPLEGCGALVFPDMFTLPHASEAFDEYGRLMDASRADRLRKDVVGFVRLVDALMPVCGNPESEEIARRRREVAAALEEESELQPPAS